MPSKINLLAICILLVTLLILVVGDHSTFLFYPQFMIKVFLFSFVKNPSMLRYFSFSPTHPCSKCIKTVETTSSRCNTIDLNKPFLYVFVFPLKILIYVNCEICNWIVMLFFFILNTIVVCRQETFSSDYAVT